MPVSAQCPCGKRYKLKDSLAGRKLKCKECGQGFTVPSPQQAAPRESEATYDLAPAELPPRIDDTVRKKSTTKKPKEKTAAVYFDASDEPDWLKWIVIVAAIPMGFVWSYMMYNMEARFGGPPKLSGDAFGDAFARAYLTFGKWPFVLMGPVISIGAVSIGIAKLFGENDDE